MIMTGFQHAPLSKISFLLFLLGGLFLTVGRGTYGYCFSVIAYRDGGEIFQDCVIAKRTSCMDIFLPGCVDPSTFSIVSSPPIRSISIKKMLGTYKKQVQELKKRIFFLQKKKKEVEDKISVNKTLMTLWRTQANSQFHSPRTLDEVALLVRKNLDYLYLSQRKLFNKIEVLNLQIQHLEKRQNRLTGGKQYYYHVTICFSSPTSSSARVSYRYFSHNISWNSYYLLKLYTRKRKGELLWMGRIFQHTGDDWKGVQLTFSTLPHRERMKPFPLEEWVVVERSRIFYQKTMAMKNMARGEPSPEAKALSPKEENRNTKIQVNKKWLEQEIRVGSVSLNSGDSKKIILERFHPLISYGYLYRPLSGMGVFLKANITLEDGENRGIPAGNYDIFIDGSFRGKRYIPDIYHKAIVFLGIDRGIAVRTISEKNTTGEIGIVSKKATRRFLWKTILKNNKDKKVRIKIEVPWPQSTNEKIKVENLSKGFIIKDRTLEREIVLLPGERKEIEFGFLILYPREMDIEIIRNVLREANH